MLKLSAALMASLTAAQTMDEMREAAELFKVTVKEDEVLKLQTQARALEEETIKYIANTQSGRYGKLLAQDVFALSQTQEFSDFFSFL